MTRQRNMKSLASAILATIPAFVAATNDCSTENAPNLLVNPSFETGVDGWSTNFGLTASTDCASDGTHSLKSSAVYAANVLSQTVNDLAVGTEYEFSIDYRIAVTDYAYITETCTAYLYHDSLSYANLFGSKVASYTINSDKIWITLSGKYTATSSSTLFGFYVACTPYRLPQISIYADNAIVRGKGSSLAVSLESSAQYKF
ncbi:hypothetical protein F4803DRAFT_569825 [Xylaria telfairii]|nr:hypothetical protein F4803DRAFT_569825 [Xylaria telfairii]